MERTISATEARIHFGSLMQRVINEQVPVIVEKSGQSQVAILSIEHYKRLQNAREKDWLLHLEGLHTLLKQQESPQMPLEVSDIIQQMRGERDEQLLDLP